MRLTILKIKRSTRRLMANSIALTLILLLSHSRELSQLETIQANGLLKMITRQGPITYYENAKGKNGFDYLLAKDFADFLEVDLNVTTTESLGQLFTLIGGPNGHFAAATLTITPERQKHYQFSLPYADVVQSVLYRRGSKAPRNIADILNKPIAVVAHSSHEEHLQTLQQQHPDLSWLPMANREMIELMEMVSKGEAEFAIIDSTTYEAHITMYPMVATGFDISSPQKLAWAFPLSGDNSLLKAANQFMRKATESGRIAELNARFFSDIEHFPLAGSKLFIQRATTRLPKYLPFFQETADKMGLDLLFLAAIAYQESHWNPKAVSPTGVKGMMMLTHGAAKEVGVKNRRDAKQSIDGGAKYFLATKKRIAKDIMEPDRTWFALAAYNVGLGHLEDARVLTERGGKDPHLWAHVKQFLPLLQKQKYYSTVRYGYARGQEPVNYVRNVRKYLRLLRWGNTENIRRNKREEKRQAPPPLNWNPHSFKTL